MERIELYKLIKMVFMSERLAILHVCWLPAPLILASLKKKGINFTERRKPKQTAYICLNVA